jgi:hypothetical protein
MATTISCHDINTGSIPVGSAIFIAPQTLIVMCGFRKADKVLQVHRRAPCQLSSMQ